MEKQKKHYDAANVDVILFEFSDIVTASGAASGEDAPSTGDWNNSGWTT